MSTVGWVCLEVVFFSITTSRTMQSLRKMIINDFNYKQITLQVKMVRCVWSIKVEILRFFYVSFLFNWFHHALYLHSDDIRTQNMVTTLLNHLLEAHEAQSSLTTYKLFLFLFVLVIYYLTFFEQIWWPLSSVRPSQVIRDSLVSSRTCNFCSVPRNFDIIANCDSG